MNPATIVTAALAALQGILAVIAELRGAGGMTDAQLLAAIQTQTGTNDALYQTIITALNLPAGS